MKNNVKITEDAFNVFLISTNGGKILFGLWLKQLYKTNSKSHNRVCLYFLVKFFSFEQFLKLHHWSFFLFFFFLNSMRRYKEKKSPYKEVEDELSLACIMNILLWFIKLWSWLPINVAKTSRSKSLAVSHLINNMLSA